MKEKTILVVEDELPLSRAACDGLKKKGYQAIAVRTAKDAFEVLESSVVIDAIWLDHYLLAGSTGLDLLYDIRNDHRFENLPVFVVTNSVSHDKVGSYRLMKIEKYYIKAESKLSDIILEIDKTLGM